MEVTTAVQHTAAVVASWPFGEVANGRLWALRLFGSQKLEQLTDRF